MNKALFIFTCTYLFLANACYASLPSSGFYLGGALGHGQTVLARPAQVTSFDRNGQTWAILGGFQFNPFFSIEAGYNRMHNVFAAGIIDGLDVQDIVEPSFTYGALKGSLPVFDRFVLYGKTGAAYSYGKEKLTIEGQTTINSQAKTVPFAAFGIAYATTDKLSIDCNVASAFKRRMVPRLTTGSIGFTYLITQG